MFLFSYGLRASTFNLEARSLLGPCSRPYIMGVDALDAMWGAGVFAWCRSVRTVASNQALYVQLQPMWCRACFGSVTVCWYASVVLLLCSDRIYGLCVPAVPCCA